MHVGVDTTKALPRALPCALPRARTANVVRCLMWHMGSTRFVYKDGALDMYLITQGGRRGGECAVVGLGKVHLADLVRADHDGARRRSAQHARGQPCSHAPFHGAVRPTPIASLILPPEFGTYHGRGLASRRRRRSAAAPRAGGSSPRPGPAAAASWRRRTGSSTPLPPVAHMPARAHDGHQSRGRGRTGEGGRATA